MTGDASPTQVCIIGAGPRGLSVLERLCANERAAPLHRAVVVHVIDPALAGAGAVWRPDQSRHLLMNTVASQVTMFTDDSLQIDGPIEPGPNLYEWAAGLALLTDTGRHDADTLQEARGLGPDSYSSRALHGRYLRDCFDRVVASAPDHLTVRVHRSRVVAMADVHGVPGGPQGVRLENGTRLDRLDGVVLALGHLPVRSAAGPARTASLARIHGLVHIVPSNPADVDLDLIEPAADVIVRGLGLCFFDYLALLTVARGGTYTGEGGRTVYRESGREPRIFASSRRGVPHHARGANEKGRSGRHVPRLLTTEVVAGLRRRAAAGDQVDFRVDLWPLISREVECVYYRTLMRAAGAGADADELADRLAELPTGADPVPLLDHHGVPPHGRWNWERLAQPCAGRHFADRSAFRSWLLERLARDVADARAGNVRGPLKAALDVLRDLRNEIRLAVDHSGLEGASHRDDLDGWYTPLNAFLSIGPPVERIAQMRALVEAGVLVLTGPGTRILLDTAAPAFVAASAVVPGPPVRARALVEARLPEPDLARTADPLLRHLLDTEQIRAHSIPCSGGHRYETGGLAVTRRPPRLVDARGRAHPRRFAYGVPTEAVHWVTAAGIRPGVDSTILGDADSIARALLRLPPAARRAPATGRPGPAGVVV